MPRFKNSTTVAAACVVTWAIAVHDARAQTAADASPQQAGVLLLNNGRIIEGQIVLVGDHYDISIPGGRINVRTSEVELCCSSLEEVYQRKRAMLPLPTARNFIELAQWCQRHGLLAHAAENLGLAENLEPGHPMLPLLRRGLELAATAPVESEPTNESPGRTFSAADLDQMVREMPPGTVESFTETIQPLLVNSCTASACHGPASTTDFSLLRPAPGRPPSRRLTQRNLQAVLDQINREDAAASQLLTVPTLTHGSRTEPVFAEHNASQYQQLVDWVYRVAKAERAAGQPLVKPHLELEKPRSNTMPAVYLDAVSSREATTDTAQTSWADELKGLNLDASSAGSTAWGLGLDKPGLIDSKPTVQRGAELPLFVPKDPFDPEIFNRRYHAAKEADTPPP